LSYRLTTNFSKVNRRQNAWFPMEQGSVLPFELRCRDLRLLHPGPSRTQMTADWKRLKFAGLDDRFLSGLLYCAPRKREDHKRLTMENSKNAGAMLRYSKYTAEIYDEHGNDLGPINVSGAQSDKQARDLAKREGEKWLEENGLNRAAVRIYRRGHGLTFVEVRTAGPEVEWPRPDPDPGQKPHKFLN
jgi:hypothetical protein